MNRETTTVHIVADEPFTTKKAARARADELEAEHAKAYKDQVEALEAQNVRAAELLGRDPATVAVGLPAPPPVVEVLEDVERVLAFEIHALVPTIVDGEEVDQVRTVQMGQTLDRAAAEAELERLNTEDRSHWVGPPHTYELVEREIPDDVADEVEQAHDAALELEAEAEAAQEVNA